MYFIKRHNGRVKYSFLKNIMVYIIIIIYNIHIHARNNNFG
jgi:hypothetical protein